MKKKKIALLAILLALGANMTVFAADNKTTGTAVIATMGNEEMQESDPETIYTYDGEDYIYAKVSYGKLEYAIPRSAYGSFLKGIQEIGIKQEYFSPTAIIIGPQEDETETEARWEKEAYSYEDWDDEMWAGYTAYAETFAPDEWQQTLMEYYTLPELYAYYMGYNYFIDEWAFKEFTETGSLPGKGETETEETTAQEAAYLKIRVQYDLDSMYKKEEVYCITMDCAGQLETLLAAYDAYDEEGADIEDPNAYVSGKYQFEVGTMDEYISTYGGVSKKDAQAIVSFIKANEISEEDASDNSYMVRVRTKNGTRNIEQRYIIPQDTFMSLLSKFLNAYADHSGVSPVIDEQAADNAKG